MTEVVLIGGNGLLGSGITRVLTDDFRVIPLSRTTFPSVDIQDRSALERGLPHKVTTLIHAAGVTDELAQDAPRALQHSTTGAFNLIEVACQRGLRELVYISTQHVYGTTEGIIDEDSPTNPRSFYALCHTMTEAIVTFLAKKYDVRLLILRPAAVFGNLHEPHSFKRWSLIPFSFPQAVVESGQIVLKSSGLQYRSFVSSTRLGGYIRAFLHSTERHRIINPRGEDCMTVAAFADLVVTTYKEMTGIEARVLKPEPAVNEPTTKPLDYRSREPEPRETFDLKSHLTTLFKTLRNL
jgi:UDP-glucose 4-epimerase